MILTCALLRDHLLTMPFFELCKFSHLITLSSQLWDKVKTSVFCFDINLNILEVKTIHEGENRL